MTWDGVHDRRRGPRVALEQQFDCRFELRARVRLVDISATGTLLATETVLPAETAGRLKAVLGTSRFAPNLQVRRNAGRSRSDGTHLGAVFVGMDDESRKSLEAFLQKATA